MRVVFRVDSSLQIGSGHVMRCLTLAEGLRKNGADVIFICRKLTGNLASKISDSGFKVFELKLSDKKNIDDKLFHSKWLEVTQLLDSEQSKEIIKKIKPDWLIVDHYALDHEWELKLKPYVKYVMVIDDLADRRHECDLLLDQTLGRKKEDYDELVPKLCKMLLGTSFCLLRSEFSKWRPYSLKRRVSPKFQNLLINMGGFDVKNHTMDILSKLPECSLPSDITITIVLGRNSPNLQRIKNKIKMLNYDVVIKIDVDNMAEIMANSDIAIGAAGTTSWERCCLGLPTIQFIVAKNQQFLGKILVKKNAVLTADNLKKLVHLLGSAPTWINSVSASAAKVTDGTGVYKVIEQIAPDMEEIRVKNFGGVNLINYIDLNFSDQVYVLKMRNDITVKKWMFSQKNISQNEHRKFINKLNDRKGVHYFLVKHNNIIVGCINFSDIIVGDSAKFGIFTNPFEKTIGAGRILEATGTQYAQKMWGLKKINLEVFSNNLRAINFYKKCGFKIIGSNRYKNVDVLSMEKLRGVGADG